MDEKQIPRKHLMEMNFQEVKDKLFVKDITEFMKLWRDYRGPEPVSYAYHHSKKFDHKQLPDYIIITKIEKKIRELKEQGDIPEIIDDNGQRTLVIK